MLVMSDLGARSSSGPLLQAWSNDSRRAGIGLQRTVADSIREELGGSAGGSGAFGQLARLAFPIGIGAQGVLLENGYDAVRISGSGELPPDGDGPVEAIDEDRLGSARPGDAAHGHARSTRARARSTAPRATSWP